MRIQDHVLKEYLKNVYFIAGTACGGKSTVSRLLGAWYSMPVYDVDAAFDRHGELSTPADQPDMNLVFASADAFFLRPVEEYSRWLVNNTRQQLDFVILDLIRLSADQRVLCDAHLFLDEAEALTDEKRIAYLLREPSGVIEEYCQRHDHEGFRRYIESAADPAVAKENCQRALETVNRALWEDVKGSRYFWLEREDTRTAEATARLVAEHFGFGPPEVGPCV